MTHVSESDDRRWRGRESETGWQSSDRYDGAWPAKHWKTRIAILNSTRCRTGSQWSCCRIGVMWSHHSTPVTSITKRSSPLRNFFVQTYAYFWSVHSNNVLITKHANSRDYSASHSSSSILSNCAVCTVTVIHKMYFMDAETNSLCKESYTVDRVKQKTNNECKQKNI